MMGLGSSNRTYAQSLSRIRVKGFILFYHETLEYYITEEIDGRVESTEKKQYRYDITMENDEESQWNQINQMLRQWKRIG